MSTLKQLINSHHVRANAEWADTNPNMADMPYGSSHWRVRLTCGRRQLTTMFSMGPAHSHEPTAEDVLECLLSDASSSHESFEDWCADLGFDADSRKAERTYRIVQRQTKKLSRLLDSHYESFLYAER